MSEDGTALIERYFDAMRGKSQRVEELIALFADDAEYTQPFTGDSQTLRGKAAIGEFLRRSRTQEPPDMLVSVDRIDREGPNFRADWTCTSSAFAQPMKGY